MRPIILVGRTTIHLRRKQVTRFKWNVCIGEAPGPYPTCAHGLAKDLAHALRSAEAAIERLKKGGGACPPTS